MGVGNVENSLAEGVSLHYRASKRMERISLNSWRVHDDGCLPRSSGKFWRLMLGSQLCFAGVVSFATGIYAQAVSSSDGSFISGVGIGLVGPSMFLFPSGLVLIVRSSPFLSNCVPRSIRSVLNLIGRGLGYTAATLYASIRTCVGFVVKSGYADAPTGSGLDCDDTSELLLVSVASDDEDEPLSNPDDVDTVDPAPRPESPFSVLRLIDTICNSSPTAGSGTSKGVFSQPTLDDVERIEATRGNEPTNNISLLAHLMPSVIDTVQASMEKHTFKKIVAHCLKETVVLYGLTDDGGLGLYTNNSGWETLVRFSERVADISLNDKGHIWIVFAKSHYELVNPNQLFNPISDDSIHEITTDESLAFIAGTKGQTYYGINSNAELITKDESLNLKRIKDKCQYVSVRLNDNTKAIAIFNTSTDKQEIAYIADNFDQTKKKTKSLSKTIKPPTQFMQIEIDRYSLQQEITVYGLTHDGTVYRFKQGDDRWFPLVHAAENNEEKLVSITATKGNIWACARSGRVYKGLLDATADNTLITATLPENPICYIRLEDKRCTLDSKNYISLTFDTQELLAVYKQEVFDDNLSMYLCKRNDKYGWVYSKYVSKKLDISSSQVTSHLKQQKFLFSMALDARNYILDSLSFDKKEVIGDGRYSDVYRVVRIDDRKEFAIKTFKGKVGGTAQSPENFINETKIMFQLKHDNLVQCFGMLTYQNRWHIVMDYYGRGDLYKFLHSNLVKDETIWFWVRKILIGIGIAKGLDYMHNLNFKHRDLKSNNVLLGNDFTPKICDFGFTKETKNASMLSLTSKAPLKGWSAYEIFGEEYSECSKYTDIYSYGMVLYEIATLQIPFDGKEMEDIKKALEEGNYPPVTKDTPEKFKSVYLRCVKKDSAERLPLKEAISELEDALNIELNKQPSNV